MESQELNHLIVAFENLLTPGRSQTLSQEALDGISALSASDSTSFNQNGHFTRIYKLLNCILCPNKSGYFKLNCLHYICKNCFNSKIKSHFVDTQKFPQAFECPTCQRLHSLDDFKIIFDKDWLDMEKNIKSERIKSNRDFICSKCNCQKSCAYKAKGICGSHNYCYECVGIMARSQDWCNDKAQEAYEISENLQGFCTSCEKIVYYTGDFLTTICREHFHCYNCIQTAQENWQCQTCFIRINDSDRDKINRVLYAKCCKCNSQYERIFFIPKKCCKGDVCALCQIGSAFKCINCQVMLEKNAVELVQCFEEEKARKVDNREKVS